jgi:hypothetical protein
MHTRTQLATASTPARSTRRGYTRDGDFIARGRHKQAPTRPTALKASLLAVSDSLESLPRR